MQRKDYTKKPKVCKAYEEAISQYLTKGYIRQGRYYKRRHFPCTFPIVKTGKDTTKTRIVFDASTNKNGISLNDLMHAETKL